MRIQEFSNVFIAVTCLSISICSGQDDSRKSSNENPIVVKSRVVMIAVDPIGRMSSEVHQWPMLSLPPIVDLFLDESFHKSLNLKTPNQKSVIKRIEKLRKTFRIMDRESYVNEAKELEKRVRGILTQKQIQACENSIAAAEFYRLGPVAFGKKIGLPAEELRRIQERSLEKGPQLAEELRLTAKLFRKRIFDVLSEKNSARLNGFTEKCGSAEQGAVFMIWNDLWKLRSKSDFDGNPTYSFHAVTNGGYMGESMKYLPDEMTDTHILVTAQKWTLLDDPSIEYFFVELHEKRLQLETQLAADRDKLERSHKENNLAESKLSAQMDELVVEFRKQLKKSTEDIVTVLNEEEKQIFNGARFLALCHRTGPVSAIYSDEGKKFSGVTLTEGEINRLARRAKTLEAELKQKMLKLQRQFVEDVFLGDEVELSSKLAWAAGDYQLGIPPLEMVLIHNETYR